MIYILIAAFAIVSFVICYKEADFSSYEDGCSRTYVQLRNPAPEHNGAIIIKITSMMSLGGKNADWELNGFPKKEAAIIIGRSSSGKYTISSTGICNVTINRDVLYPEILKELKENDIICISVEGKKVPWRFEYQEGR